MVAWRASGFGGSILKVHLSIDRFEGDKKQIAVLLTDNGAQSTFPRSFYPMGTRPGSFSRSSATLKRLDRFLTRPAKPRMN